MALEALICPQCGGGVELDDNQEYGFCKYCGTKVQNSNFHKIKGDVKINYSDQIEKFLSNARRAMAKEDWEEVEKYYNLVEQHEPSNIEAIFYSSYGKCMLSLSDDNVFKREQKFNVLAKSISVLDDNFTFDDFNKNVNVILKIYKDLIKFENMSFVVNVKTNSYGFRTDDSSKTYAMIKNVYVAFCESLDNIVSIIEVTDSNKEMVFRLYEIYVDMIKRILDIGHYTSEEKKYWVDMINYLYSVMAELSPEFARQLELVEEEKEKSKLEVEQKKEKLQKKINKMKVIGVILLLCYLIISLYFSSLTIILSLFLSIYFIYYLYLNVELKNSKANKKPMNKILKGIIIYFILSIIAGLIFITFLLNTY